MLWSIRICTLVLPFLSQLCKSSSLIKHFWDNLTSPSETHILAVNGKELEQVDLFSSSDSSMFHSCTFVDTFALIKLKAIAKPCLLVAASTLQVGSLDNSSKYSIQLNWLTSNAAQTSQFLLLKKQLWSDRIVQLTIQLQNDGLELLRSVMFSD